MTTLTESYDSSSLFFTLSAILVLFWYTWRNFIRSKNLNPSSPLPPGPRGLPIVGNLLSLEPELQSYFAILAHTYGPILKLRLGTKLNIIVTSPTLARQVLKENDIVFANRDVPYIARTCTYKASGLVWTPYGPEWRMLRKVCVLKMLSNTMLDSVHSLRRREVRRGVSQLYSRVGSPVDVGEHVFLIILNVITNMLWGGAVDGDEWASVGAEFRGIVSGIIGVVAKPNISDFFPALAWCDLQGITKQHDELIERLDIFFDRMISRRTKIETEGGNGSSDFLQFLLRLKDEGDSKTPLAIINIKCLLLVQAAIIGHQLQDFIDLDFKALKQSSLMSIIKLVLSKRSILSGPNKINFFIIGCSHLCMKEFSLVLLVFVLLLRFGKFLMNITPLKKMLRLISIKHI
ncbi:flavonoid 3'-monooxygenase CYP75B137-like [Humulus lupulus]|uniref:flavonoid 3'-monooxygenase CYP75B137-like n=1 Tax=Humulus lupulus TaxID=3486 RepID=UPI002B416BC5|nr:flavonoid 3'-monooxygenase CYP75B137-like [Humulus lupulus]